MKAKLLENNVKTKLKKNDEALRSRISKSTHSLALILSYLPIDFYVIKY